MLRELALLSTEKSKFRSDIKCVYLTEVGRV